VEGITSSPDAFLSQLTMETFSPVTLYVKGPALTSLTPPNINIITAVIVVRRKFFITKIVVEK
jgi:hypothetical protein